MLTGSVTTDTALGFGSEIAAFALLLCGMWQLFTLRYDASTNLHQAFALLATAGFMLWHSRVMRERYPAFARGWQHGRDTWGKGAAHGVTLFYGLVFVTVLFPLGAFLVCLTQGASPLLSGVVLSVVYGCGLLVRRLQSANTAGNGVP